MGKTASGLFDVGGGFGDASHAFRVFDPFSGSIIEGEVDNLQGWEVI